MHSEVIIEVDKNGLTNAGDNENIQFLWSNIPSYIKNNIFSGDYSIQTSNQNYLYTPKIAISSQHVFNITNVNFIIELDFLVTHYDPYELTQLFFNTYGHLEIVIDGLQRPVLYYYGKEYTICLSVNKKILLNTRYILGVSKIEDSLYLVLMDADQPSNMASEYIKLEEQNRILKEYPLYEQLSQTESSNYYYFTRIANTIKQEKNTSITPSNNWVKRISNPSNFLYGYINYIRLDSAIGEPNSGYVTPSGITIPTDDDGKGKEGADLLNLTKGYKTKLIVNKELYPGLKNKTVRTIIGKKTTYTKTEIIYEGNTDDATSYSDPSDADLIFEMSDKTAFVLRVIEATNTMTLCMKNRKGGHQTLLKTFNSVSGSMLSVTEAWNHIALTYDKETSELAFFVNGKKAYVSTDVKDLDLGYLFLNTLAKDNGGVYYAGFKISNGLLYTDNFPITQAQGPSEPYANIIPLARKVVKNVGDESPDFKAGTGGIDEFTIICLRFVYCNLSPYTLKSKQIYKNENMIVKGQYVQLYDKIINTPAKYNVNRKIIGPLNDRTNTKEGIIEFNPLESIGLHYADSWTFEFWEARFDEDLTTYGSLVTISNTYYSFEMIDEDSYNNRTSSDYNVLAKLKTLGYKTWQHIAITYDHQTNTLVVYVGGKRAYQSTNLILNSPTNIKMGVGTKNDNAVYFSSLRYTRGVIYKSNFNPKIQLDKNGEPMDFSEALLKTSTVRRVEIPPTANVLHFYGGVDADTVDYRKFLSNNPLKNYAPTNNKYAYDVDFYSWELNKQVEMTPTLYWDGIMSISPATNVTLGIVEYLFKKSHLHTYTIDFWVYKYNNVIDDIENPVLEVRGDNNQIKIQLTEYELRYYTYINSSWELEASYSNFNFIEHWNHIAFTYDMKSRIGTVFVNGKKVHESGAFLTLPADEVYLYLNYQRRNSNRITSVRISSINRFPNDGFNINEVNYPYGEYACKVPTELVYDKTYVPKKWVATHSVTTRNVVVGGFIDLPPDDPVDPTDKFHPYYNRSKLPVSKTRRTIYRELKANELKSKLKRNVTKFNQMKAANISATVRINTARNVNLVTILPRMIERDVQLLSPLSVLKKRNGGGSITF